MRPGKGLIRVAAAVLVAAAATVGAAAPSSAHAELVWTNPQNGQTFTASRPAGLALAFTEAVGIGPGSIRLIGSGGRQIDTGKPVHPDGDGTTVQVPLSRLPSDTYTVAWRVVSTDTHVVQGAYTFTVGTGRPAAAASAAVARLEAGSPTAVAGYGLFRWLALVALALLIGVTFFVTACWPGGRAGRGVRRTIWLAWLASVLTALGTGLTFGPQAAGVGLSQLLSPRLLSDTLDSRTGTALLARLILLALFAPALFGLLRANRAGRLQPAAVLAAGAALAATWSAGTHSAVGSDAWLALPADVAHLVAMAVWLGGLGALVFLLLAGRDPAGRDLAGMRTAVPAFSRAAGWCVGVLVLTGVFAGWRQLGSPEALTGTSYGRLLLIKLAAVAVLVALGAGARSWVQAHYGRAIVARADPVRRWAPPSGGSLDQQDPAAGAVRVFRRRVAIEFVLGLVVLAISAVLVTTQPGRAAADRRGPVSRAGPVAAQPALPAGLVLFDAGGAAGKGELSIDVSPAKVGVAVLHLSVLDRAGRPKAVADVQVSLQLPAQRIGPVPVSLGKAGLGHYASVMKVPLPGRWDIIVTVRTSDIDSASVQTSVEVVA